MSWLGMLVLVVFLIVGDLLYLVWYQRWEGRNTRGMAYYGKSLSERRALKSRIRWYSWFALPIVKVIAAMNQKQATMPTFEYEGVCGPPQVSSPEIFKHAKNYQPRPEDVFVATQMRCGTTWMQNVVYEIVNRGDGDLSDRGHNHLYAISPWIDACNSVSLENAPLVGINPVRIIKTHLPIQLCPYSTTAKYIYVTRHPVSCFASIVDFNRTMLGPLMPSLEILETWFCSDRMYWRPWPEHIAGWWQWAQSRENVLFVHFEDMKADFLVVLDEVASFLGYQLTGGEKERIAEKCSFNYMKEHEEYFEMSPPNMFSVSAGQFLATGEKSRYQDVTSDIRGRIIEYCRQSLKKHHYPVHQYYPDLSVPQASENEHEDSVQET